MHLFYSLTGYMPCCMDLEHHIRTPENTTLPHPDKGNHKQTFALRKVELKLILRYVPF